MLGELVKGYFIMDICEGIHLPWLNTLYQLRGVS